MSLVRRRRIPLSLEHMSQMPATVTTHDLRPRHSKRPVLMPRHRTRERIEEGGPSTSGLELVVRAVERRVAGGAVVDAGAGHVLVVFAGEGGFGALPTDDTELL